jgi:hypothetical protein
MGGLEPIKKKNKSKWTGVWIALYIILVALMYYW